MKVRYKQTALGVAWAVLQPLLTVVVFTIFFNRDREHLDRRRPLPGLLPGRPRALDVLRERA